MGIRVFFLAVLIGLVNSELPYWRRCDPIESSDTPTVCSNYRNIEFIYKEHKYLHRTVMDLKNYAENNRDMLERLKETLTNGLAELTRSTENQNTTIQSLRDDVNKLEKHQERVRGNFSDIEQRVDISERQLMEKQAKLESLEMETEAAFNSTKTLLDSYKDELSHLNSMAQGLQVQLEGQLNVTKMELEEKLEAIEKNAEGKLENLEMEIEASFNDTENLLETHKNELSHLNRMARDLEVKFESQLDATKTDLENKLAMIQETTDAKIVHLETEREASINNTKTQLDSHKNQLSRLNSTTWDLGVHLESRLNVTKIELEGQLHTIILRSEELTRFTNNHKADITVLKNEVDKLEKHQERFGGNFSDIEGRLDVTERLLTEKKAKLENLETETEAAFNSSKLLLNSYKKELSHLKSTAQELEVKFEAKLNVTKMNLEDKMETIQKNSHVLSMTLHHEKSVLGSKIETLNKSINELQLQNLTVNHRLNQIAVQKKVAFAATVIESAHSFTGPYSPGSSNVLTFDRVFTNIGNAYDKKTGIFTAPVDGVYQFSFMTFGYNSHTSGAILVKNGHYQVSTWEFTGPDASDTTSNSVILEMNAGDGVNIILWQGGKIHTSVFSGFLIFPLA